MLYFQNLQKIANFTVQLYTVKCLQKNVQKMMKYSFLKSPCHFEFAKKIAKFQIT